MERPDGYSALGGLFGTGVAHFLPFASHPVPAGYALVGMAAMIAATTHAPLMAAVLVFDRPIRDLR